MAALVMRIRERTRQHRKKRPSLTDDGENDSPFGEVGDTFKKNAAAAGRTCDGTLYGQAAVRRLYANQYVQLTVAAMIVVNFLCTVAEKEVDPFSRDRQRFPTVWIVIDHGFTWCFVVELLLNIYGNWLCEFWHSGCVVPCRAC